MRLFKITPSAIADLVRSRRAHVLRARQLAELRRELSRLPRYVADDIGAGPNQDRFINFAD